MSSRKLVLGDAMVGCAFVAVSGDGLAAPPAVLQPKVQAPPVAPVVGTTFTRTYATAAAAAELSPGRTISRRWGGAACRTDLRQDGAPHVPTETLRCTTDASPGMNYVTINKPW